MIRWTKPVKFVFLLPAVFWVLAFTVFPLGYSLYLSFHDVDRKVVVTGREKVPVLNDAGEPVLKKSGEPRTKTKVHRELQTKFTWNGFASFIRAFGDEEVGTAVKVTAIFVFAGVTIEIVLGFLLAFLFHRYIFGRSVLRTIMILPIFATPIAVGYLFFTVFYEIGGPLEFMGIPWLSHPDWAWFRSYWSIYGKAQLGIVSVTSSRRRRGRRDRWRMEPAQIVVQIAGGDPAAGSQEVLPAAVAAVHRLHMQIAPDIDRLGSRG